MIKISAISVFYLLIYFLDLFPTFSTVTFISLFVFYGTDCNEGTLALHLQVSNRVEHKTHLSKMLTIEKVIKNIW